MKENDLVLSEPNFTFGPTYKTQCVGKTSTTHNSDHTIPTVVQGDGCKDSFVS